MLQTEPVGKSLWNLLKDLQKEKALGNYFLVGGTALALQLGHRMSDDIDLFTRNDISPVKRSLVYFDDVTESNWSSVKLLKGTLPMEKVKQRIINEMNNYARGVIGAFI